MNKKENKIIIVIAIIGFILLGMAYREFTKNDDKAIQNCVEQGYTYNSCMKGLVG